MNKTTILIFGKNENRNAALVEDLNANYQTVTATTDEQAIEKFQQSVIEAVIFSEGVTVTEKAKLEKIFSLQDEATAFVNDIEDSQLEVLITNAISTKRKQNKPSFSFKDDALKNAGLNIEIQ